ncbi:hypothetical protein LAZ67_14001718 [Cordylochernes scorpioides]|uniref:Transposase Tc1-like domain-containing protein n=1 Tax=Cordylochernes scorpioides TaxID=51811 RepID=A0ABY6L688_9ARAC|nr:hypothetical protein LAZ67_14001718 [Cordylochernes scorpioides]
MLARVEQNGKMQRQDGSGRRPRDTTKREDREIVRTTVAAPDSTLSTIQRVTGTQVSKILIERRLRDRNLRDRRPLRCLPLTSIHRQRPVDSEASGRTAKRTCVQAASGEASPNRTTNAQVKSTRMYDDSAKESSVQSQVGSAGKVQQCAYLEIYPDISQAQYLLTLEAKLVKGSIYQLTKLERHILVGLSRGNSPTSLYKKALISRTPPLVLLSEEKSRVNFSQ